MHKLPPEVPLFRDEAVRHRMDTLFGDLLIPPDRATTWITVAIVGLVALMAAVLASGHYAPRARVTGWLATAPGAARIASPQGGVIAHVHVANGAVVGKGDPLITVSAARHSTKTADVGAAVVAQLKRQHESLRQQITAEEQLARVLGQQALEQVRTHRTNLKSLEDLAALYEDKLRLAERDEQRAAALVARGALPRSAEDQARNTTLGARLVFQEARQKIKAERAAAERAEVDWKTGPLHLSKRIAELEMAEAELGRQIAEAEGSADLVVRSEVDGEVTGLTAHRGDSVLPGTELMTLVPTGATLFAEILVPTRAAGFLKPGMRVRIRYDAFPYEKFGQYEGVVSEIGSVVLSTAEQRGPMTLNEPAYVVRADLREQATQGYGTRFGLRPGMTFQADILQESRRLIEWIFDPLYALGRPLGQ